MFLYGYSVICVCNFRLKLTTASAISTESDTFVKVTPSSEYAVMNVLRVFVPFLEVS